MDYEDLFKEYEKIHNDLKQISEAIRALIIAIQSKQF